MQFSRIRETSPFCDSDEEVFIGPVTSKELEKASKLKRRTQVYFPTFNWKPSETSTAVPSSPIGSENMNGDTSKKSDANEGHCSDVNVCNAEKSDDGAVPVPEKSAENSRISSLNVSQILLGLSDDSLERGSGGSNQALSGDREPILSAKTLLFKDNLGKMTDMVTNISLQSEDNTNDDVVILEDSLESAWNLKKVTPPELPVQTEDNLNSNFQQLKIPFQTIQSLPMDRSLSSENQQFAWFPSQDSIPRDSVQRVNNVEPAQPSQHDMPPELGNSTQSARWTAYSVHPDEIPCPSVEADVMNCLPVDTNTSPSECMKMTEALNGVSQNTVYNSLVTNCAGKFDVLNVDVPSTQNNSSDAVTADKDGGFLSFLSEAALYHASKNQDRSTSSHTQQSLEDRFHDFGVTDDELEKQQLSESIMYTTGRDSCLPYNASAYFPLKSNKIDDCDSPVQTTSIVSHLDEKHVVLDLSSGSAQSSAPAHDEILITSEKVLHQSLQKMKERETSDSNTLYRSSLEDGNQKNENARKSISELCELEEVLNESSEMHTAHSDLADCSVASCLSDKMNDTLEEYEMMMRYGVDYIMGNIKKKDKTEEPQNVPVEVRNMDAYGANLLSKADGPNVLSPLPHKKVELDKKYSPPPEKHKDEVVSLCKTPASSQKKVTNEPSPMLSYQTGIKLSSQNVPQSCKSSIPRVMRNVCTTPREQDTPSRVDRKMTEGVTPACGTKTSSFKKPTIPVSASRLPKYATSTTPRNNFPKASPKGRGNVQSPISAYIHKTASPVLFTNVKAKVKDVSCWQSEMQARALWKAGEGVSGIPKAKGSQVTNIENLNPNVECGLPPVKYTKAPCINLGEPDGLHLPKSCEKINKLMNIPCPQVIKHEGRLNIKSGSPLLAAKVQAVSVCPDDSMVGIGSASGDISVCVTQTAERTDTLSLRSPKPTMKF